MRPIRVEFWRQWNSKNKVEWELKTCIENLKKLKLITTANNVIFDDLLHTLLLSVELKCDLVSSEENLLEKT